MLTVWYNRLNLNETVNIMNLAEASKTLGLSFPYSEGDVQQTVRKLRAINHPDKGGNDDAMAQINKAYSILKNTKSGYEVTLDWKEIRERNELKAADLSTTIKATFDVSEFLDYFQSYAGEELDYTISDTVSQWHGGIKVKFFNADNSVVFTFDALTSTTGRNKPTFSAFNENISFELMITAYGYVNRKKVKMARRDWAFDNDHTALLDPRKTFGKVKMGKIFNQPKTVEMKKADMQLAMEYELGAKTVNDSEFIPLGNDYFLKVYRMVFMRMPAWCFSGIAYRDGYTYKNTNHKVYHTFYENSDTVDTLLKLKALGNDFDAIIAEVEKLK